MHPVAREVGYNIDNSCMGIGLDSMLLFFGDLTTVRVGFTKLIDAHATILQRVQQGEATVEGCA